MRWSSRTWIISVIVNIRINCLNLLVTEELNEIDMECGKEGGCEWKLLITKGQRKEMKSRKKWIGIWPKGSMFGNSTDKTIEWGELTQQPVHDFLYHRHRPTMSHPCLQQNSSGRLLRYFSIDIFDVSMGGGALTCDSMRNIATLRLCVVSCLVIALGLIPSSWIDQLRIISMRLHSGFRYNRDSQSTQYVWKIVSGWIYTNISTTCF